MRDLRYYKEDCAGLQAAAGEKGLRAKTVEVVVRPRAAPFGGRVLRAYFGGCVRGESVGWLVPCGTEGEGLGGWGFGRVLASSRVRGIGAC